MSARLLAGFGGIWTGKCATNCGEGRIVVEVDGFALGFDAEFIRVPGVGHNIFFEQAVRDAVRRWLGR